MFLIFSIAVSAVISRSLSRRNSLTIENEANHESDRLLQRGYSSQTTVQCSTSGLRAKDGDAGKMLDGLVGVFQVAPQRSNVARPTSYDGGITCNRPTPKLSSNACDGSLVEVLQVTSAGHVMGFVSCTRLKIES